MYSWIARSVNFLRCQLVLRKDSNGFSVFVFSMALRRKPSPPTMPKELPAPGATITMSKSGEKANA